VDDDRLERQLVADTHAERLGGRPERRSDRIAFVPGQAVQEDGDRAQIELWKSQYSSMLSVRIAPLQVSTVTPPNPTSLTNRRFCSGSANENIPPAPNAPPPIV